MKRLLILILLLSPVLTKAQLSVAPPITINTSMIKLPSVSYKIDRFSIYADFYFDDSNFETLLMNNGNVIDFKTVNAIKVKYHITKKLRVYVKLLAGDSNYYIFAIQQKF